MKESLVYQEEDGWELFRESGTYLVTGTCEGLFEYEYEPGRMYLPNGDPGYPDSSSLSLEEFDCWIDKIYNEKGETVKITLEDNEWEDFHSYMRTELWNMAEEYDFGEAQ